MTVLETQKGSSPKVHPSSHPAVFPLISAYPAATTLALASELIQYDLDSNGTYEFTRILDRTRDALPRDSGYSLKTENSALETSSSYTYFPTDGRISQISNPQIPNQLFSYSYTPNSDLLASVTGPVHTVTNTWEPNRDLLDTKQNKVGSTTISNYDYAVNAIGQRTGVTTGGTAFPATPSWAWGYDALGQVVTADSSVATSDRSYQYDAIGNRQKSADSLTLPAANNYVATAANNYSSVQKSGGTTSFTHDLDGNMTQGNRSVLVWDAENRLVLMKAGNPIFEYKYNAQGRRISQRCTTFPAVANIYIYDAWNCIAEYDQTQTTTPATTLAKTRLWGIDLSGTRQGAGGVGGLLSETHISNPQSPIHYPTYDGNGNISEYLTSTGSIAAHFKYDPFGNTVVNTDTGNQFTYRFSTKPLTQYTGLYYYGYRYYDPRNGRWPSRDPIKSSGFNAIGESVILYFSLDSVDSEQDGDEVPDDDLFEYVDIVIMNDYGILNNQTIGHIDYLGLDINIYSTGTGFGIKGINHVYAKQTRKNGASRGRAGSWGKNRGGGSKQSKGDKKVGKIKLPKGKSEKDFMDDLNKNAEKGPYIPWVNDCHTSIERSADNIGGSFEKNGDYGGRLGK